MTVEQDYLDCLLEEIKTAKINGKHGIYKINARVRDNTAKYVKKYFENNYYYDIDIRKCASCRGTWDILITFRNV